jgi:multidrug efflux system membrane fusion protein
LAFYYRSFHRLGCGAAGALLLLLLAGCQSKGSTAPPGKKEAAVPVVVAMVTQKDVPVEIQVIGNVEAYSTITVKAQAGGELTKVFFQEGDYVTKGARLFTIDSRGYEAQIKQAEANLLRDTAMLAQARANLARDVANEQYAKAQAERYAKLFQEGVMSREQTEQFKTSADASSQAVAADRASIESAQAQMAADRATIENLRVQLGYTQIFSPIEGRTGNVMVKQGNVVTANVDSLVMITQVQPIYATFAVPESYLAQVKNFMAHGQLKVEATPQDTDAKPEIGVLTFVDNAVDANTGTIKMKGTFTNPARKLWPGQFVRVTLRLTTEMNALVVPNQAVQSGQEGQFVYVVKADKTVEFRPVTTGSRIDQELVISKGLQPGETVVTEGQLRLAPGSRVSMKDSPKPPA